MESIKRLKSGECRVKNLHIQLWKHMFNIDFDTSLLSTLQSPLFKKGFTLAEVLIALGVIGVVAAMTMPTLITKYQKQAAVAQLKKTQSMIEQAVQMSVAQNGTIDEWNFDLQGDEFAKTYIIPYIKIIEDCGVSEVETKCAIKGYYLNGNEYLPTYYNNWNFIITADGSKLGVRHSTDGNLSFIIDMNGDKGPNVWGKDIFLSYFTKDENGVYKARLDGIHTNNPYEISADNLKNHTLYGCNKTATYSGSWCGGWIQYNSWKLPDDYPW